MSSVKRCSHCQQSFSSLLVGQVYCSKPCRKKGPCVVHPNQLAVVASQRPTRLDASLHTLTPQLLESLLSTGARYSESTIKKHSWVIRLYEGFMKNYLKVEPWPLDPVSSAAFIRFLGLHIKYAVSSIEDVIIPSLKRINIEKSQEGNSGELVDYFSQALRDIKGSRNQLRLSATKEPAIVPDVQRVIESTPDSLPSKAEEVSLWLTALTSGARAITCDNILVSDIVSIYRSASGTMLVQLRLRVTKGNPNWNHIVTLEGNENIHSNLNVVYWLNRHLKSAFDLDLAQVALWNLGSIGSQKL